MVADDRRRRLLRPELVLVRQLDADLLIDPETGLPHTYHTLFPVPLILASNYAGPLREGGALRDISPTILGLAGVDQPVEMTGRDLRDLS